MFRPPVLRMDTRASIHEYSDCCLSLQTYLSYIGVNTLSSYQVTVFFNPHDRRKHFQSRRWGSLLPALRMLDPPISLPWTCWKFYGAHVSRVTIKHFPQPLSEVISKVLEP